MEDRLIKVPSGNIVSKSSKKKAILKELETAFIEAKEIKDGKRQGVMLNQILCTS